MKRRGLNVAFVGAVEPSVRSRISPDTHRAFATGALAGAVLSIVPAWWYGFPLILATAAGVSAGLLKASQRLRPSLLLAWIAGAVITVSVAAAAPFKFDDRWRIDLEPHVTFGLSDLESMLEAGGFHVISHVDLPSDEKLSFGGANPSLQELNMLLGTTLAIEVKPMATCLHSLGCSILRGCDGYPLALIRSIQNQP